MQVTLNIQDDLLASLISRAQEAGGSVEGAIDELLREALEQPLPESTLVDSLLSEAIEGIEPLVAGSEFSLDDVLDADAWNSMTGGERKSLGRRFRKQVEMSGVAKWLRRNSANKAIYLKK